MFIWVSQWYFQWVTNKGRLRRLQGLPCCSCHTWNSLRQHVTLRLLWCLFSDSCNSRTRKLFFLLTYLLLSHKSLVTNLAEVSIAGNPDGLWPQRLSSPTSDSFRRASTAALSLASSDVDPTPLKNCGGLVHSCTTDTYSVLLLFCIDKQFTAIYGI